MNSAAEAITVGPTPSRLVQVRTKILKENDVVARAGNRFKRRASTS